jgi:NADH-quinone oxidoreductase subunit L
VVTLPLILLAVPSVLIGYLTIEPLLFGDFLSDAIHVNADTHHAMHGLEEAFHGPLAMALHALTSLPFVLAFAGVVTAWYMYLVNPALPRAIGAALRPVVVVLENKYYFDWFNENVLARGARLLGTAFWQGGDRRLIDGFLVNGSWKTVAMLAGWVRRGQSGYLYHYALVMAVGLFALLTVSLWHGPLALLLRALMAWFPFF